MEKAPHKKDELMISNHVLQLATKLLKVMCCYLWGFFSALFDVQETKVSAFTKINSRCSVSCVIFRNGCKLNVPIMEN